MDGRGIGVRFLGEARDFSLFHIIQAEFEAHATSYKMGSGSSFPEAKAAGA
jgi:hypothetical protein